MVISEVDSSLLMNIKACVRRTSINNDDKNLFNIDKTRMYCFLLINFFIYNQIFDKYNFNKVIKCTKSKTNDFKLEFYFK